MKKIYIILLALFLGISACQRSQFAMTTRHSSNGKVTFVKHYSAERSRSSKVKLPKHQLNEVKAQNNLPAPLGTVTGNLPVPEITTINPAPISEDINLIASTSIQPTIILVNKNRGVGDNEPLLSESIRYRAADIDYSPDTIKMIAPKTGTTMDFSVLRLLKFKDGHHVLARVIYQSNDTLFYKSSLHSRVTKIVNVKEVDTILIVKYVDSTTGKVIDKRKTEPNGIAGLILSILGIIPVIGLPLSILAVIFGAKSLRRIKRNPERYKGKGTAMAGLIIGGLAVAGLAILIIVIVISGGIGMG